MQRTRGREIESEMKTEIESEPKRARTHTQCVTSISSAFNAEHNQSKCIAVLFRTRFTISLLIKSTLFMCHRQIAVPLHYSSFFLSFSVCTLCVLARCVWKRLISMYIITSSDFNTPFLHAIPHNHLIRKLTFALPISPIPSLSVAWLLRSPPGLSDHDSDNDKSISCIFLLLSTGLFSLTDCRFRNKCRTVGNGTGCFLFPFLSSRSFEFNVNHINLVPLKDRTKDQ